MPVQKGRLKPDDEKRIQANYIDLIADIVPNDLVVRLYQSQIIFKDDMEDILSERTRKHQAKALIDKILEAGPGEAYNGFVECLKDQHEHLVKKLNSTDLSNSSGSSEFPDSSIPDEIKERVITDADASRLAGCFATNSNWTSVLMRLEITKSTIDTVLQSHGVRDNLEAATNLLIKWRQKMPKGATVGAIIKVFHEVDQDGICSVDWPRVRNAIEKMK